MLMPEWFKFTLAILATWRISASLYYGKEFDWLRYRWMAEIDEDGVPLNWLGQQIGCFWCVSFWVAWPVAALAWLWWPVLVPVAVSGGAVLLSGGGRVIWRAGQND